MPLFSLCPSPTNPRRWETGVQKVKQVSKTYGWQTRRWDPRRVSVSGTVREVLTVGVGGGLPLTGITNSSATKCGLKTASISSSVNWASEPYHYPQAGQLHRVVRRETLRVRTNGNCSRSHLLGGGSYKLHTELSSCISQLHPWFSCILSHLPYPIHNYSQLSENSCSEMQTHETFHLFKARYPLN